MKIFYKILLLPIFYFSLEQLIRTQTDGFRIEKTYFDTFSNVKSNLNQSNEIPGCLNQPFYFLGSGVQCYAFLSEDETTVLKVFKHYHLWPTSEILSKFPLPAPLNLWRNTSLEKRKKRLQALLTSAQIANTTLRDKTGTFYLNLTQTAGLYPEITIFDKIGIRRKLNLNKTPFLLQKKADLIFSYLETHPKKTKEIIDSLFFCLKNRADKRIANTDPVLHKNFGIVGGEVVEIDIGSFEPPTSVDNPLYFRREIFFETLEIENWIKRHRPEHLDYFQSKRLEAIQI